MVIKGATALALPTRKGQQFELKTGTGSEVVWKALDHDGKEWFTANIDLMGFEIIKSSDETLARKLAKVLTSACRDNSDFLSKWKKYRVTTKLEFPREWGLGSSASLIYLIAQWAEANPYSMYFDLESGSGYDIAATQAESPLLYTYKGDSLDISPVEFNPPFKDQLFFIPLGNKADSSAAVRSFLKKKTRKQDIEKASSLTARMLEANSLTQFNELIQEHEEFVGNILGETPIKQRLFKDFTGAVKSLGAWGGDMILATGNGKMDTTEYFQSKGYPTVIPFDELILT